MTTGEDRAIVPVVAEQLRNVRSTNVLFSVIMVIVIALMSGLNAYEARKAAARVNRSTECIIEQFAEHRAANEAAHRAAAEKLGASYPFQVDQGPPDVLERLHAACRPFIR